MDRERVRRMGYPQPMRDSWDEVGKGVANSLG